MEAPKKGGKNAKNDKKSAKNRKTHDIVVCEWLCIAVDMYLFNGSTIAQCSIE